MRIVTNENEKLALGGVLRGCLYMLVVFVAAVIIQFIIIERNEVEHRKEHPNAAKINNEIAPEYAKTISDALNRYFADHKEYPWQIFGGQLGWRTEDPKKDIDPLIAHGYLSEGYPRHYTPNHNFAGIGIINLVSAPHDAIIKELMDRTPPEPDKPRSDQYQNPKNFKREMARYEIRLADYKERLARYKKFWAAVDVVYAAGGIRPRSAWRVERLGNPGPEPSIVLPGLQEEMKYLNMYWPHYPTPAEFSCNFGYVRGERMGADKKTAFLWIYGRPSPPFDNASLSEEVLNGLDVLNAETGELKPDGIPDGVALKFELREGQVVNITKADSM